MKNNEYILIIEDDPDGLASLKDAIEDAGYNVITANNGTKGIEAFKGNNCLVVISDNTGFIAFCIF